MTNKNCNLIINIFPNKGLDPADCKTGLDFSGSRSGLRVYLEKVSSSYFPSVYFTFQVEAFASAVSAGLCIAGVVTNNNNRRSCDFAPAPEPEATLSPESRRRHIVTHGLVIPLLGFPSLCRKGTFSPLLSVALHMVPAMLVP